MITSVDPRFARLRSLKQLLDEAYRVPGTNIRFGWDAIVGLVPGAGDIVTALFACATIVEAHHMRVPRIVQLRMVVNVLIDIFVGIVPLFGDVADVFWKSTTRNMALLDRHVARPGPPSTGDWLFVAGVVGAIALMALLPLFMLYWFLNQLPR